MIYAQCYFRPPKKLLHDSLIPTSLSALCPLLCQHINSHSSATHFRCQTCAKSFKNMTFLAKTQTDHGLRASNTKTPNLQYSQSFCCEWAQLGPTTWGRGGRGYGQRVGRSTEHTGNKAKRFKVLSCPGVLLVLLQQL